MIVTNSAQAAGRPDLELCFSYDHQGRRLQKKVTDHGNSANNYDHRFLYDGWNLIAEYKASAGNTLTITKTHHWGHDLSNTPQGAGGVGGLLATSIKQSNGSWKSYLPSYDGNGNIIAWTSETGGVLQRIDYDPFGNTLTKNGSFPDEEKLTFGFSTKYEDNETGLLYYGYRYYDPVTGRWPSRDPIEEEGGINLYGMVENSAINYVDKNGLTILNILDKYLSSKIQDYIENKQKEIGDDIEDDLNDYFEDLRDLIDEELDPKLKPEPKPKPPKPDFRGWCTYQCSLNGQGKSGDTEVCVYANCVLSFGEDVCPDLSGKVIYQAKNAPGCNKKDCPDPQTIKLREDEELEDFFNEGEFPQDYVPQP